jgi:hypothetical protein
MSWARSDRVLLLEILRANRRSIIKNSSPSGMRGSSRKIH